MKDLRKGEAEANQCLHEQQNNWFCPKCSYTFHNFKNIFDNGQIQTFINIVYSSESDRINKLLQQRKQHELQNQQKPRNEQQISENKKEEAKVSEKNAIKNDQILKNPPKFKSKESESKKTLENSSEKRNTSSCKTNKLENAIEKKEEKKNRGSHKTNRSIKQETSAEVQNVMEQISNKTQSPPENSNEKQKEKKAETEQVPSPTSNQNQNSNDQTQSIPTLPQHSESKDATPTPKKEKAEEAPPVAGSVLQEEDEDLSETESIKTTSTPWIYKAYHTSTTVEMREYQLYLLHSSLLHMKLTKLHVLNLTPKFQNYLDTRHKTWAQVHQICSTPIHHVLKFDALIESGNLHSVQMLNVNQYNLQMSVDTNTKGHQQWFYFNVSNMRENQNVTFNITNFTKPFCLFKNGMKVQCFSKIAHKYTGVGWHSAGCNFRYLRNHIPRSGWRRPGPLNLGRFFLGVFLWF